MENIRYSTEIVIKHKIHSVRGGEKIICKLGRQTNGKDNKFWDVWDTLFPIFEVECGEKRSLNKIYFGSGISNIGSLFILEKENGNQQWKILLQNGEKQNGWKYIFSKYYNFTKNNANVGAKNINILKFLQFLFFIRIWLF